MKIVFSCGSSLTSSTAASVGAAAGAAPAAGKAISGIFKVVFNSAIKEEVSNKVNFEISETIAVIFGSTGFDSDSTAVEFKRMADVKIGVLLNGNQGEEGTRVEKWQIS